MAGIPSDWRKILEKQQYEFAGEHTAVKICTWTKKSLRDEDVCYKERFYGIESHRCCQMSPSIGYCQNRCMFCWRPTEYTMSFPMRGKVDDPKKLVRECIEAQRKQLSGFGGNKMVNKKKFREAQDPNHLAISLAGEPLMYPKLNQLIRETHKQGMTTFVVTNALVPERLKEIEPPTQLYISLDAPDEELFSKIDRSRLKDAWKRLNKSLDIMKNLKNKTRTCIRITCINGLNMVKPEKYAELIRKADPLFVEVKAYMWVGFSQYRLEISNMPMHDEVRHFAEEIGKRCGYKVVDEKEESRVVLLMEKDFRGRKMKF
ncbi:4-demethylwyosine synthase TYW1 [Candidatus Woesearchaeota archaeon]|nr:4-demethylwyosine synthase TYW1 [Candidatus Woesearchaeota archaeon]